MGTSNSHENEWPLEELDDEKMETMKFCFSPLLVDSEYNVLNGLMGMGRFIILRLCGFMGETPESVKMLFGIDDQFLTWRSSRIFFNIRKGYVYKFPLRRADNNIILTQTPFGEHCLFTKGLKTIFLDSKISEGIYHWTVRIKYPMKRRSEIMIGTAPGSGRFFEYSYLTQTDMTCFHMGTFCLHFTFNPPQLTNSTHELNHPQVTDLTQNISPTLETNPTQETNPTHSKGETITPPKSSCNFFGSWKYFNDEEMEVEEAERRFEEEDRKRKSLAPDLPNNSLVSVEVDASERTLSYFINGKKIPWVGTNLPNFPLSVGITGSRGVSFTSLSLRRLMHPTPSTVVVHVFEYKLYAPLPID